MEFSDVTIHTSPRRAPTRNASPSKNFKESLIAGTKANKVRKGAKADTVDWEVKGVLAERSVRGRLEYLVDWVNSSQGERFQPEWISHDNLGQYWREIWKQGQFRQKKEQSRSPRRKRQSVASDAARGAPPVQRARRAQSSPHPKGQTPEIPDTYEDEKHTPQPVVEIYIADHTKFGEYNTLVISSQSQADSRISISGGSSFHHPADSLQQQTQPSVSHPCVLQTDLDLAEPSIPSVSSLPRRTLPYISDQLVGELADSQDDCFFYRIPQVSTLTTNPGPERPLPSIQKAGDEAFLSTLAKLISSSNDVGSSTTRSTSTYSYKPDLSRDIVPGTEDHVSPIGRLPSTAEASDTLGPQKAEPGIETQDSEVEKIHAAHSASTVLQTTSINEGQAIQSPSSVVNLANCGFLNHVITNIPVSFDPVEQGKSLQKSMHHIDGKRRTLHESLGTKISAGTPTSISRGEVNQSKKDIDRPSTAPPEIIPSFSSDACLPKKSRRESPSVKSRLPETSTERGQQRQTRPSDLITDDPSQQESTISEDYSVGKQHGMGHSVAPVALESRAPFRDQIHSESVHSEIYQMLPLRESVTENAVEGMKFETSSTFIDSEELILNVDSKYLYVIPLPMAAIARDIYDTVIREHRSDIETLVRTGFSTGMSPKLNLMLENLKKICDNPELLDDDASTQATSNTEFVARHAENVSTKCMFLIEMLEALRYRSDHVAIFVRPGHMLDIIQAMLQMHKFNFVRPDANTEEDTSKRDPLQVSLLPTGQLDAQYNVEFISCIVAFDSTYREDDISTAFQGQYLLSALDAPVLYLATVHSIEHLELCLPDSPEESDRKRTLTFYSTQLRKRVGLLPPQFYPAPDSVARNKVNDGFVQAAHDVAEFIHDAQGEWPLPPMPEIERLTPLIQVTPLQVDTEIAPLAASSTQSVNDSNHSSMHVMSLKRPSESLEPDPNIPKRQRLMPVDSIDSNVRDCDQIAALFVKVSDLEQQLQAKNVAEERYRADRTALESRNLDLERSIKYIQPKYQEALDERGKADYDMRKASNAETAALAQVEKLEQKNIGLEEAINAAKAHHQQMNKLSQTDQLAIVQKQLSEAQIEKASLSHKVHSLENDIAYLRAMHNEDSMATLTLRREIDALTGENKVLKTKADDNIVRIHELTRKGAMESTEEEFRELRDTLTESEARNQRLLEQNRALSAARRGVRGSALDGSPRISTVGSPRSGAPGRVLARGSRGNSPAAGMGLGKDIEEYTGPAPARGTFGSSGSAQSFYANGSMHMGVQQRVGTRMG